MHIIIGLITAIGGLLWALNSLQRGGVDLGWLNPFSWNHRRKWRQKYQQIPLYNLKNTMEAAAVIIVGTLKQEGEVSREQKQFAISTFQEMFKINENDATEMFGSCTFLLKNTHNDIDEHVSNILETLKDDFTESQINSLIDTVSKASEVDGKATEAQRRTIDNLNGEFNKTQAQSSW